MKKIHVAILLGLLIIGIAGVSGANPTCEEDGWNNDEANNCGTGVANSTGAGSSAIGWQNTTLPEHDTRHEADAPILAKNNSIYVGSGPEVTSFWKNGTHRWSFNMSTLQENYSNVLALAIGDGKIYVGAEMEATANNDDGNITALHTSNGSIAWDITVELRNFQNGGFVYSNKTLYTFGLGPASIGNNFALNTTSKSISRTERILWLVDRPLGGGQAGQEATDTPPLGNGTLYWAMTNGSASYVDPIEADFSDSGPEIRFDNTSQLQLTYANNSIYVLTYAENLPGDEALYAFDGDMNRKWSQTGLDPAIGVDPIYYEGRIYTLTRDMRVHTVDENGTHLERDSIPEVGPDDPYSWGMGSDGIVYIFSENTTDSNVVQVTAYDVESNDTIWIKRMNIGSFGPRYSGVTVYQGSTFTLSTDGTLTAFDGELTCEVLLGTIASGGQIDRQGLLTAIDYWRNDQITTVCLLTAIDYWRNDTPVS